MTETTPEKKDTSRANSLYAKATTALREAHRDEFEALLDKEYLEAGLVRVRRRTPEEVAAEKAAAAKAREEAKEQARKEKAKATLDALLAEFPDLAPDATPF